MSDNNFFSDSFSNSLSSIRKVPSSFLEDKLSKEILPYEIEFASKNSNIVFPLYEKMRYNKMKELVPYDNYIGRYIITKNVKDFNSSNNNNGIIWKISAVDNMILKLENISAPGNSMSLSSSNNIINNSKHKSIDLGDQENENKIFLVEYAFLSKSLQDNFIIVVSNFYNNNSLINKDPNGEVYYCGFSFNFSSSFNYLISPMITEVEKGLIFQEKIKANSLLDIKSKFFGNNTSYINDKNMLLNESSWYNSGNNNLLMNNFSNNITLYKNFLLCMEINKKYKNFLRNIEYKEIEVINLRKYILYEIVYDNSLYLLLDYNKKYDSYLLKKYFDGGQNWVKSIELMTDKNNNIIINSPNSILCNELKGLVCMSSLQSDANSNYSYLYYTNNNFSNINNYLNKFNYEFENTITIPIFDNPIYESKIILNNRRELLSHLECSQCSYKINNFQAYLCQTCKKLYHKGCIDKDKKKNPLFYHYFFCNNINCSPCVICKGNQPQLSSDKYKCKKCKFVFHSKCLIKEIRDIYTNLNQEHFLCENCIQCSKCGLNAYNLNTEKKDNKFNCEANLCLYCERKINKKEYCKICDELWYNKDANLLIECVKCKYSFHKNCDKIIFTNANNNIIKKNKYLCPFCRINKKLNCINNLIKDLKNLDQNEYFIKPVNLNDFPNYLKVIKDPICFEDIENKNLKENTYLKDMDKFFQDVLLISDNAMTFNMPRTPVYEIAAEMKKNMEKILNENYKFLYQLSMDYWLFDFNEEKNVQKSEEERMNYIKNNFMNIFWKYIQNKNRNENNEDKDNIEMTDINNTTNNSNNNNEINIVKFREEFAKFGNDYIQKNIFEYNITWNWLLDIGLTPYNKDIKLPTNYNSNLIDNYSDNQTSNNDLYINIDHKNASSANNINMKLNLKKKFKAYDEISYELDFHNSNFESSKKVSKFLTSSNNLSHTMELILNNHKNLDYLDTNEFLFNNYEKNIDNDKKLSFLYPEKFRYYLPTKKQNLKSSFNDFMSSFIIRLEDNKKAKNLKKKLEGNIYNINDKEGNFDFDENEEFKDDDKNDQDYIMPGTGKKKKGNNKKANKTKKKKFNKISNSNKLSNQKNNELMNNKSGIAIKNNDRANIIKNNSEEINMIDVNNSNNGVLLNVNINSNKDVNININTDLKDNEYLKKELIKKLTMKFITICFNKFSLIFEPNCSLCGSFEDKDKFIFCSKCENAFHSYCIDESLDINKIKELNNWRCAFCKVCMKCNKSISINDIIYNNDNILFCKSCDNCCHVKCLTFVMNTESYKYKCEKCFKCVMCKSNKYYDENFPLNKNKDYSFFTRDYDYCYECGLTVFYNSLCNKCLLSDFKNISKKLIFIKTRIDLENFEKDYNINQENIINININDQNEKDEIKEKYIIMLYCESCKSWCHASCFGMNYFEIKEYFKKFKDFDYFICLDCFLKNKLGEQYNKFAAVTYLEILSTSFKLMVLSKIILIILKGHYNEVNSSIKLHSKLIKTFIKNNYEIMLQNKNIQLLFNLFKIDIFLIKETNQNLSAKKKKSKSSLTLDINDKLNNNIFKDNKSISSEKNKINNNSWEGIINYEENISDKINIEYDEEIENKLNQVNNEQNIKKVNGNKYWQKHLMRLLMKKYKRKSWYQRMYKKKLWIDIPRENDFNYKVQFNKNIINDFTENLNNKEKFNEFSLFNVHEHTQSIINYEIKNIFKTENEYDYNDYPSDLEISPELDQLNNIGDNSLNNNGKLLGIKKERTINLNESDDINIKTLKDQKAENDFNINNKKNKKCYYIKHGDKRRLRKILKRYTKNNMNNNSLINNKNYIPNSIIDLYEYDSNDYFCKLEQQENEKVEDTIPDKMFEEKKSLINEVYFNLLSLKNNYNPDDGEKIINYSSKINSFIICIIFESIKFIRELLLSWLINTLLEESNSNSIYKNFEEMISKSDNNNNNINLEELNKYFDHIDKLIDSPNNNQECILCHRKGGRELSGRLIYLKNELWIHINCLFWSKGILLNNYNEISQVESLMNKASSFKCFLCKRGGATIFCSVPKCERKYHFLCGYIKKCSFSKDYKVFCNRCSHCNSDDTDEVIKINLNKLFIIHYRESNANENINLGNAFKDKDTPKYQVGTYNKTGNSTILKFFLINSKEHSFETLDLAILKVKLISKNIEIVGINETGTYYFTQFNIDENKIKNALIRNGINNCIQQSDFSGLIKDLENNEENLDNLLDSSKRENSKNNDIVIQPEENICDKLENKIKNYIFIEPMKNKDNSLNLNYCKNRIERNENVEYILNELNKQFIKYNKHNLENEVIQMPNLNNKSKNINKKLEIFKYFNFGFDIKKIYSSNNPISIIHQYLTKFSSNMPGLNQLENMNFAHLKDSDTIKDLSNLENKEDNLNQNYAININKINSLECHSTNNNNELASDLNSINTMTNNFTDINNKELSTHLTVPGKKKSKAVNSNNNNNLLNNNLSKLDYFVNLINEKNKININQTNHLCFKLQNYIISHKELITEKTKLTSEESQFPLNEDNIYSSSLNKKKSSNKKYNKKNSDLNSDSNDLIDANDEQGIAQKYKTYINQPNLKVCIGPSIIHRNGLFALDNIKPGEIVIEYVGEMITNKIADYREIEYNQRGFGDCYMFRFDADNIIDATKYGNLARFINHCCEPNCKAQCNEINGKKHILLLAKKFIKAGEEITYDYNFEVESEKIQCRCGAKNCRGRLN